MDLLRKLMNGGDSQAAVTGDIERLLTHVQEERQTLHTLLVSFEGHAADMPRVSASLDEAGRRADALANQTRASRGANGRFRGHSTAGRRASNPRRLARGRGADGRRAGPSRPWRARLGSRSIAKPWSSWCRWGATRSDRSTR